MRYKTCEYCKKEYDSNYDNRRKYCCQSCAAFDTHRTEAHKVSRLLENTNEAFYWIGFFLADGSIKNKSSLRIEIGKKDIKHLLKFSEFICYKRELKEKEISFEILLGDKINLNKIIEKFDIRERKTYNPPNMELYKKFNKDNLLSLLVGFIDGDGSIDSVLLENKYKVFRLSIENYYTWTNFYKLIEEEFSNMGYKPKQNKRYKITSKDTVRICFCEKNFLYKLNKKIRTLKIPFMERKWDVLNNIVIKIP